MSAATGPVLVLDSGSPRVSVAVGRQGLLLAERSAEVARSSTFLLQMIDEALATAGLAPADLAGVAALAGPGSFTGLRIGLATALGLHQALGIAATALPTLAVLAACSPGARTLAAVDVLRGEWAVQEWRDGRGGAMEILAAADLAQLAGSPPATVVGFGVGRLAEIPGWPPGARLLEPGPLAPAGLGLLPADLAAWDPGLLTAPIYGRPAAVTAPRPRAVMPAGALGGSGARR